MRLIAYKRTHLSHVSWMCSFIFSTVWDYWTILVNRKSFALCEKSIRTRLELFSGVCLVDRSGNILLLNDQISNPICIRTKLKWRNVMQKPLVECISTNHQRMLICPIHQGMNPMVMDGINVLRASPFTSARVLTANGSKRTSFTVWSFCPLCSLGVWVTLWSFWWKKR